jgi:DNA-binding NarL/FixJ family response regulator
MKTTQDGKVIAGVFRFGSAQPSSEPRHPLRVWLAADDDAFRELLGSLLDKTDVVKCDRGFASGELLLHTLSREAAPQTIVLDVQLRERSGIDFIKPIKALAPATRVLMLTALFDPKESARALRAGASAFLAKSASLHHVLKQVLACAAEHRLGLGHSLRPRVSGRFA